MKMCSVYSFIFLQIKLILIYINIFALGLVLKQRHEVSFYFQIIDVNYIIKITCTCSTFLLKAVMLLSQSKGGLPLLYME